MNLQDKLSDSAVQDLLLRDTQQLYELLGMRIKAIEEDPNKQGEFELSVKVEDHMGLLDGAEFMASVRAIGQRMFNKVQVQAYQLFCGSNPDDEEDRSKIKAALKISAEAAVTVLTGVLISTIGLAAAIASVIAAIIIKRFIQPAIGAGNTAMCELWKEHLPES